MKEIIGWFGAETYVWKLAAFLCLIMKNIHEIEW